MRLKQTNSKQQTKLPTQKIMKSIKEKAIKTGKCGVQVAPSIDLSVQGMPSRTVKMLVRRGQYIGYKERVHYEAMIELKSHDLRDLIRSTIHHSTIRGQDNNIIFCSANLLTASRTELESEPGAERYELFKRSEKSSRVLTDMILKKCFPEIGENDTEKMFISVPAEFLSELWLWVTVTIPVDQA
jgi:hypothetical protein